MREDVLGGLEDKVVVVTGAAGGQGVAECEILADNGAIVVALDLLPEPGAALEAIERRHRGRLSYRTLDVTRESDWAVVADELADKHGRVDGLVNNAGTSWRARLGDIDVGSLAGITAHHTVAYTASKWGLRGLSAVAATALGPRGIRSNIVHPGYIETPMMASVPAAMKPAQLSLTPLGRVGEAQDVARVVAYLLSDLSSYVTGAEIPIDGGFSASRGAKVIADALAPSSGDQTPQ